VICAVSSSQSNRLHRFLKESSLPSYFIPRLL